MVRRHKRREVFVTCLASGVGLAVFGEPLT